MNLGNFLAELKRRNVYKVAVAYLVAGWALAQGVAQVLPVFDTPNWVVRVLVILIVLGLPVALTLAWLFDLTPQGIKRTTAETVQTARGETNRGWIYVVIIGGLVSVGLFSLGRYSVSIKETVPPKVAAKSIAVLPF